MNSSSYRLEVTAKGNGTFDHTVVEVATGRVVGTRNSRKHYPVATVARVNLDWQIARDREVLTWSGRSEAALANDRARLEGHLAAKARGELLPAFVLSFNGKPTPPSARYGYDLVAYATESAS